MDNIGFYSIPSVLCTFVPRSDLNGTHFSAQPQWVTTGLISHKFKNLTQGLHNLDNPGPMCSG